MADEKNTTSKLEEVLEKGRGEYNENKANQDLNSANEFYNKMVDDGVIQKRGYTLRGIDDPYPSAMYLNSRTRQQDSNDFHNSSNNLRP